MASEAFGENLGGIAVACQQDLLAAEYHRIRRSSRSTAAAGIGNQVPQTCPEAPFGRISAIICVPILGLGKRES